jgi:hypothetical protein
MKKRLVNNAALLFVACLELPMAIAPIALGNAAAGGR